MKYLALLLAVGSSLGLAASSDEAAGCGHHEPVAYIVGEQEFFGLPFRISPAVLIPRADSETLVDRALAARPAARRVLDCGIGSGALLLAVLAGLPEAEGVGIDRSYPALLIARTVSAAITALEADELAATAGRAV